MADTKTKIPVSIGKTLISKTVKGAASKAAKLPKAMESKLESLTGRNSKNGDGDEASSKAAPVTTDNPKVTTFLEDIDIGKPVSVVYNQWTQFEEFSSFMKGVEGVDRDDDDVHSTWRLKVFLSRRTHEATITEQVPDRRIAWTSDSQKGSTKGVVTFHPLADDLTRVLVVIDYTPSGFFEKTANLWRAPGRRARLDLKRFREYVMMRGEETGAWRGEIHDSEVTQKPDGGGR